MQGVSLLSRKRIAWHPAFFEAIQAEFIDYLDILTFEAEHILNTEPLKIDVLVIKNPKNSVVKKISELYLKLLISSNLKAGQIK